MIKTDEYVSNKRTKKKKTLRKNANETEINNLLDKEFKALIVRKLLEVEKRIDEHSESFNKEIENIKRSNQK